MNREILFRGQTRRHGEQVLMGTGEKLPGRWVYGGVLQGTGAYSIIYGGENVEKPREGMDKWVVYTDTVGQYTGLVDNNGRRIFEGDILAGAWNTKLVIYFDEDYLQFRAREVSLYARENPIDYYNNGELEVIGNIHDNPELLEAEKN